MAVHAHLRAVVAAGILLLPMPGGAQVQLGDLRMSMDGNVAPGYSATYGNMSTGSTHGWTFGGSSTLTGSYHSPNFFSFNTGLFLNQSRANSDYQSISNASGVNLSTTIFGGSEFPGSVGYSLAYNSDGNYGVPGLANYVTHGDSDTFSVNWNENIPEMPSLSAGFQMGSSKYTVYGTNDDGTNGFHTINVHSSYRVAGFGLGAYYSDGGSQSLIPGIVTGESAEATHSNDDTYGFNVSHRLPMAGSVSGGFNRSSFSTIYANTTSSGTIDLLNMEASIHPAEKVSVSASANYSDNLSGQLIQAILGVGGVPGVNLNQASDSLDLLAEAGYSPSANLQASASVERRTQSYLGEDYGVTSYGMSADYSRTARLGAFNSALSATLNTDDKTGDNTLGFTATENYSGEIRNWKVSGSFSYAQNVQTLLVTYMNSFYNYSSNVHRRWGRVSFAAGAAGGRTALTGQAGTESSSQSYNVTMGYNPLFTASASYAHAQGQALATGAGLIPVPIPPPVLPSSLLSLYGGNSYSMSASSTPLKKLVLSASYAKSLSSTASGGTSSENENDQYNVFIQYQLRKLNFVSGYARMEQGFTNSGVPPQIVVSYYAGISRWFKFF